MDINQILNEATKLNSSDVHLFTDHPPIFRIHGELLPSDLPTLNEQDLKALLCSMITDKQRSTFEEFRELDFSYSFDRNFDFRVNAHYGEKKIAATIRILPQKIMSREDLNLPIVIDSLCRKRHGLIILSGTAGSGKSTTMTYLLDMINRERKYKIITIEDPIEYHHQHKQAFILQREVGSDTHTFANALKYALRQDPDVVAVGEVRDLESISMALTAAETGHLVLTTVHAPDAVETINRIVDVYPIGHRDQIFIQLARNIQGIVSQTLVPRKDQEGRILATEVMVSTIAIQNLIRRGALVELRGQLDADRESGMHSLEWLLNEMVYEGLITEDTAKDHANYAHTLEHFKQAKIAKLHAKSTMTDSDSQAIQKQLSRKILIIDSNDHDRVNIVLKLKGQGYENVFYATDGAEGEEVIDKENPDVIALDSLISDRDCFELCKRIKQDICPHAKVIITCSDITNPLIRAAQNSDADDLVAKTFDHHLLCRSITGESGDKLPEQEQPPDNPSQK